MIFIQILSKIVSNLSNSLKIENIDFALGTTCGTSHIPGFQGFLPVESRNPRVAHYASGKDIKKKNDAALVQNFHQNMPGYGGFVAKVAINDQGPRQITSLTTASDFNAIYR